jgi:hypothetical protein
VKGFLWHTTLRTLVNEAWNLLGIQARLLYEPRRMPSSGEIAADGMRIKRNALLPTSPAPLLQSMRAPTTSQLWLPLLAALRHMGTSPQPSNSMLRGGLQPSCRT